MDIKNSDLANLKELFYKLPSYDEETVKISIVSSFLKLLGYKDEWFHYEYPTFGRKRRVDISIHINGLNNNKLFVEVKRADKNLSADDVTQISNYLHDQNIEWGILTDSRNYILINKKIDATSINKVVMQYNLISPEKDEISVYNKIPTRNKQNLNYFKYQSLYKTKITNYFRYLTEYNNHIQNDGSRNQYDSAITSFFYYLSNEYDRFELGNIRPSDFINFLKKDIEGKKLSNKRHANSQKTILSKYRYIKSLCKMLKSNNEIHDNPFERFSEDELLENFDIIEPNNNLKDISPLKNEEIEMLFGLYNKSRTPERNKLMLKLFLYLALDIKNIKELKVEDINLDKKIIKIYDREFFLTENLCRDIKQYLSWRQKKAMVSPFFFCTKYGKSFNQIDDSTINDIISQNFNKIDIPLDRKKVLTPSFIKASVIKRMYENGFTIDELSYLTGLSTSSIEQYLDLGESSGKNKLKKMLTKHPYIGFF